MIAFFSGLWFVLLTSLFDGAVSIRSHLDVDVVHDINVEKSNHSVAVQDNLYCYCRQVKGLDECQDNKYADDPQRPDGPRFYHSDGGQTLCCKRDSAAFLNRLFGVGFSYHKQSDMSLCNSETTQVNPTSCCHILEQSDIGFRVTSAHAKIILGEDDGTTKPMYAKTKAIVKLSDISGAVNWNGRKLSSEEAQLYIQSVLKKGDRVPQVLSCAEDIRSLVKVENNNCLLRQSEPKKCCCLTTFNETPSSVSHMMTDNHRCLKVEGAPETVDEEIVMSSSLNSYEVAPGVEETDVTEPTPQESPTASFVNRMESSKDDSFIWQYQRAHQWTGVCLEWKEVPTGQIENGRSKIKFYLQTKKKVCSTRRWTRECPAGSARYTRLIQKGQCFSATKGLVEGPAFSYNCPADYSSGKKSWCSCENCY